MDAFTFSEPNAWPETPAMARTHLMGSGIKLCAAAQMRYHSSGVGKWLYLVKWSCPELANSVWELIWFMTEAFPNCMKGMGQCHATCAVHNCMCAGHAVGWLVGW